MYALVDIKGFQYKLQKGDKLKVPKYDLEAGKKISISEVLLVSSGKEIKIGTPFVEGAVVKATVTGHDKDKKIIVFKKKKRKDYSVKKGHRQEYTEIVIDNIRVSSKKTASKAQKKKETKADEIETVAPPQKSEVVKTGPAKSARETKVIETEASKAATPKKDKEAAVAVKKPRKTNTKKPKASVKTPSQKKIKKQEKPAKSTGKTE